MTKEIIIVEDDELLRENLSELLRLDGFHVTECGCASEFMTLISKQRFGVAIIDVGLPDKSGYEIANVVRETTKMGIIILTARTGIDNKIQGFSSGADYYFSKPVDSRELTASINNLLCRLSTLADSKDLAVSHEKSWIFNANGWLLTSPDGIKIKLTSKESDFIRLLLNNQKDGVEKESILSQLGYLSEEPYGSRALGVMVTRFRKKLKDAVGENELIKTVHGFGFLLGDRLVCK